MSEETVKLVVVLPLLAMAEFYRAPFRLKTESPIAISLQDEGKIVRGRIDELGLQDRLWVLVVESKEAGFSLKNANLAAPPERFARCGQHVEISQPDDRGHDPCLDRVPIQLPDSPKSTAGRISLSWVIF